MSEIILNERAAAVDALENRNLGSAPARTLMRVAKYYHSEGYKQGEIRQLLEQFMLRCYPDIRLGKWDNVLEYCSKNAGKKPLVEIDSVGITQNELDKIASVNGGMAQRVLFTLLCLAKLGNAISPKNNNWVNREHKDIFSLANSRTINQKRRCDMLRWMWNNGLIDFSKIVDNINIRVMIVDDESPVVIRVGDFRNLGNQYRMYCGENYMQCECCGVVIKKNANNQRYCRDCHIVEQKKQKKKWYQDNKKNNNN